MPQFLQNNPVPAWRLVGAIAVTALALSLGACNKGSGDTAKATDGSAKVDKVDKDGKPIVPDSVPVEVALVSRRSIAASYAGTASLEAPQEAQVVAKTSGVLLQLLAEEGDRVKAGQVLARIDPEQTRLEVERQQATVNKLSNNYRRAKELLAQRLVSADASDQIRYDLESAQASLDLAKLQLSYTNITAPISGVIAQRMVKAGNLVALNAPVFRVVNTAHLEGVLNVPERETGRLKAGLPVRMAVDAVSGKLFEGKVDRISPVVDAGSGTFRVVCAFDNASDLRPGMFGRMEIVYDQRADVLTLPRTALLEDEGESAVYVVRQKKAVRVPVQLGYMDGELAEVRSGLRLGEQVITAGKVAVRDGTLVEIIKPAAMPAAAGATDSSTAAAN
jgi:membrane fusion protein (multidrug efflux system)